MGGQDHLIAKTQIQNYIIREKTKSIDGGRFCPNVTFEDNEFKDNKALNDQGKDKGTIKFNFYSILKQSYWAYLTTKTSKTNGSDTI